MTSKERVRTVAQKRMPDQIPAAFEAVASVTDRLLREYGYSDIGELRERYQIDIIPVGPAYIGPALPEKLNARGETVRTSYWGSESTTHTTAIDRYSVTTHYPLNGKDTIAEIDKYRWPSPDWFDYEGLKRACDRHRDKALIFGHEGPFQIITALKSMDEFFVGMSLNPDVTRHILKKLSEFELEYYERCLIAADGQLDVLRPHDDYGTQISLLFSVDMWERYFEENTRKLTGLAHSYGAYYQQHSCGAVEPLIEKFIGCGVDILEPLQQVRDMNPERLAGKYGGRIAFHGGVDTQFLLPNGTPDEVRRGTRKLMETLGPKGYILMASQAFEPDVSTANIETIYATDRHI